MEKKLEYSEEGLRMTLKRDCKWGGPEYEKYKNGFVNYRLLKEIIMIMEPRMMVRAGTSKVVRTRNSQRMWRMKKIV